MLITKNTNDPISSLSDFEVISELGKGSFGSVFKVLRKTDSKIYAMKKVTLSKLNPKEIENALNEVRLLASIVNPNIIEYKDAFYDSMINSLCLVMEYAEFGDLEKKIVQKVKSKASFSEIEIISILTQIVKGLKALHNSKVIHRDIKAANIFIFKGNVIKIGDLNVSKLVNKKSFKHTQTGTPYYASPEVWDNMPYDYKSDIWSLGCILYEMCALHAPFRGGSIKVVYDKVKKCQYDPIPKNYSRIVSGLVNICLQANPVNRPSCKQLLSIIRDGGVNLFNSNRLMTHSPKCNGEDRRMRMRNCNQLTLGRNGRVDIKESHTGNNEDDDDIDNEYERFNSNNNISLLKTIKMPKTLKDINSVLPRNHYVSVTRRIKSAFKCNINLPKLLKNNNTNTNGNSSANVINKNLIPLLQNNYSALNVKETPKPKEYKDKYKYNNITLSPARQDINDTIIDEEIQLSAHKPNYNYYKPNEILIEENIIPMMKKQKKVTIKCLRPLENNSNKCALMRKRILNKEINDHYNTYDVNDLSTNNKTAADPRKLLSDLHNDITQVEAILNNLSKLSSNQDSAQRNLQHQHHPHYEYKKNRSELKMKLIPALMNKADTLTNKDKDNDLSTNYNNKKRDNSSIHNNSHIQCIEIDNKLHKENKNAYNNYYNHLPTIERNKLLFPTTPSLKSNDNGHNHSKQQSSYHEYSFEKRDDMMMMPYHHNKLKANKKIPEHNAVQLLNQMNNKQRINNLPIKLCKLPYDKQQINFESKITIAQDVNRIIKGFKIINNS